MFTCFVRFCAVDDDLEVLFLRFFCSVYWLLDLFGYSRIRQFDKLNSNEN